MIKQLITDLAYDNIKLSQALTRAKIIANKLKNETFKSWLNKELEGYTYDDTYLPDYRKVWSPVQLVAEFPTGQTHNFPVIPPDDLTSEFQDAINKHRIAEPISIVEAQIANIEESNGYINLPRQLIDAISGPYTKQVRIYRGVIRKGYREIGKVHYQSVIELTKQKLLDTLMELENEFPDLINEYAMTKENNDKVQNIITNHIYGNNSPTTIAAGVNVEQTVNYNSLTQEDESKLKEYGLLEDEIEELKKIVASKSNDKPSFVGKAMKWLGSVTASVAGRGLYDNIPAITDFVHKLTS
jgi:hypothetical protein